MSSTKRPPPDPWDDLLPPTHPRGQHRYQPSTPPASKPEQPHGPGAICEDCGHFSARHHPGGCDTTDLVRAGIRPAPCPCPGMLWVGTRWPRPWLPAPEGLATASG